MRTGSFADLVEAVKACRACGQMRGVRKVLGAQNGSLNATVLFLAEAPGRLGADRTGVPLFGDKAGHNFRSLLRSTGLSGSQIFITNAVLCNPRDQLGNNRRPTSEEVRNCAVYLRELIQIIKPRVIVTLGKTALVSLRLIRNHDIELRRDVANAMPWDGCTVFPLYHPGARAMVHRNLSEQMSDYYRLWEYLRDCHVL